MCRVPGGAPGDSRQTAECKVLGCATLFTNMYCAIDIGGTKTLVAQFDDSGNVGEQIKFATSSDYQEFKQQLSDALSQLPHAAYDAAGVGVRGRVNRHEGLLEWDSVLNWRDAPIRDDCAEILGCPVSLENDTKLAGLSEAEALGHTYKEVLYITISTGIGTALITSGNIEDAVANSEFGKSVYPHDGKMLPWEDFASGRAIVEQFGMRASEIEDHAIWQTVAENLAPGFINAAAAYNPDVIVVGGGVGSHLHKFQAELQTAIDAINHQGINVPTIVQAKRPEEAVIYGCYEIAKRLTA